MNGSKKWYESKTIIAAIVTIITSSVVLVNSFTSLDINVSTVEGILNKIVEQIPAVITLIGGIGAWFGRVKADKKIG